MSVDGLGSLVEASGFGVQVSGTLVSAGACRLTRIPKPLTSKPET